MIGHVVGYFHILFRRGDQDSREQWFLNLGRGRMEGGLCVSLDGSLNYLLLVDLIDDAISTALKASVCELITFLTLIACKATLSV